SKITKNLSQNEVHSDPDLILYNPSVLIDKEPKKEALPEVQQRVVPQKINEHFALKVSKKQEKLFYFLILLNH
ncbi:hypothetical protein DJ552_12910, partial [Enterococcus faecium]|uniref:hypothetical protein n=1 Tax=Enterococcus faecium TaxID=1352 RepID=UPI00124EC8B1